MTVRLKRMAGACLLAATAVLASLVSGCASYPPAPAAAASDDYNYIIGPGDQLNIQVWRNPELSMGVPVPPVQPARCFFGGMLARSTLQEEVTLR